MAELSAYILAYNESKNVAPLMESLKGVRDVVVLDNGSTDDTVEKFRGLGARVYDGTKIGKYEATEQDAADFRERFGFEPGFKAGMIFDHAGERRNHAASLCRNDWVVNPDCDERMEWDLKKLRPQLNGQGGIRHRYVFKHNPDGSPLVDFIQCKLYNRRKGMYTGRIHEVIVDRETQKPVTSDFSTDVVIHHWQEEKPERTGNIHQMEYQAVREETVRNLHYLGREYADNSRFENALAVYARYFAIDRTDFPEQRSQAHLVQADCLRQLKRMDEAVDAYHRAMVMDDTRREPFFMLAQLYMEHGHYKKALVYFTAATAIPYNPQGFMNDLRLYTWGTHDKLSVCYQRLGMQEAAYFHWTEALKHLPDGPEGARILANGRWMVKKA